MGSTWILKAKGDRCAFLLVLNKPNIKFKMRLLERHLLLQMIPGIEWQCHLQYPIRI